MEKVFIAGHNGLVGSSIYKKIKETNNYQVLVSDHSKLDLLIANQVNIFFETYQPDVVILAAAKVGGINANITYPADFLYENLQIQNNIFEACKNNNVKKLVFLGSSCIYPKDCLQPMKEEYLLTGVLEPTNEGYAIAKIAGLKMAEYYKKQYGLNTISLIPCNVYGNNDSFNLETSHVMSALIKKFIDAKINNLSELKLWGTGIARREFMHVYDLAEAIIFLINNWDSSEIINVGTGEDISIKDLSNIISEKVHFNGQITWDSSKPDGMLKKCMDITKLNKLGFECKISLEDGIDSLIQEYKNIRERNI